MGNINGNEASNPENQEANMSTKPIFVVDPPPIKPGQNIQAKMYEEIDKLGEVEGKGGNARAELGIKCVQWAHEGVADVADAKPIYVRYLEAVKKQADQYGGVRQGRGKADPEDATKQNVSKFRQFLKMGGLKTIDPIAVIKRAEEVVKRERAKGSIRNPPFEALLKIVQSQCANANEAITDAKMVEVNQPRVPLDRFEADELMTMVTRLESHEDKWGQSDEVTGSIDKLKTRIDALGGTSAQKKQNENLKAAEAEKARRKAAAKKK